MKIVRLEELKGNEILEKSVISEDCKVLLAEGTVLKPEYIEKLSEFDIKEVYVKEEKIADEEEIAILKKDVEEHFTEKIKDIIETHTYQHNESLVEICNTADRIIGEIVTDENVMEQVFDIKERSSDIYEHSINLCTLATLTALKMDFSEEEVHHIGVGCLLHDIGLRYLTVHYEDQNLASLSDMEISEYKKHTVYGYSALKNEKWIHNISKNIILYHHECLDGSGYPLHSREIPIEAQIVAVCDVFDEMICGIGCERVKVYEAVEYLKAFKNVKFNGTIVDVFLEFTAVYPVGSRVLTNEGEEGVVLRQNNKFPSRPVLLMEKKKNGEEYREKVIKDLLHENHVFIEKVLS